ncbi:hypothetical protein BACT_1289 [Bifidobacterium actinocoloniiforme DSM 22766]|uniref:Uncharacterized protein n=1 Tax=Bifidobacterium actinocoloniiforme DSM 22766 TaxID=1437605 RepID=A0A086Z235_9BIFI|nr:hypothetical protein [Bifidobacterium actinocoloniiforme]AKV55989.1 hypothetical protein AB656_07420 [Bifidobacterium actinocoloniiforme DSM 22766]KFI40585.1 hypothetical protein BACT_1289 [Bifidobacterium actinocoloniiforme DSM 22766]
MDFFAWQGWGAVEAIATVVAMASVVVALMTYRDDRKRARDEKINQEKDRRQKAAWVTAWAAKHDGANGVIIENDSAHFIADVQIDVCGHWSVWPQKAHDTKSARTLPGKASTWSVIPPGFWQVQPDVKYPSSHPVPVTLGLGEGEWVPNYGDSALYVSRLAYTDYKGDRWERRIAESGNCLVLGQPVQVKDLRESKE